jgi:hypothetical protein
MVNRQQVNAYGTFWTFTVYQTGIALHLTKQGKTIGGKTLFRTWQDALAYCEPASFTRVFVVAEPDVIFLPR